LDKHDGKDESIHSGGEGYYLVSVRRCRKHANNCKSSFGSLERFHVPRKTVQGKKGWQLRRKVFFVKKIVRKGGSINLNWGFDAFESHEGEIP